MKKSATILSQKAGRAPSSCLHPLLGKLQASIELIELALLDLGVAAASAEANQVLQGSQRVPKNQKKARTCARKNNKSLQLHFHGLGPS